MKHHKKTRKPRARTRRAAEAVENDIRSFEELHPIYDPSSRPEPSVADMLQRGEGQLGDR